MPKMIVPPAVEVNGIAVAGSVKVSLEYGNPTRTELPEVVEYPLPPPVKYDVIVIYDITVVEGEGSGDPTISVPELNVVNPLAPAYKVMVFVT